MVDTSSFQSQMDFRVDDEKKTGILRLKGDLTIQCALPLKDALADSLQYVDNCKLDLNDVTTIDISCIQVFYSAYKTALDSGKQFSLYGECSPLFYKIIETAGYSRLDWLCFKSVDT